MPDQLDDELTAHIIRELSEITGKLPHTFFAASYYQLWYIRERLI